MTQHDLIRAVAQATGETLSTVAARRFTLADPTDVDFDPEPYKLDVEDRIVDWDRLDAERHRPVVLPPMVAQPAA